MIGDALSTSIFVLRPELPPTVSVRSRMKIVA